MTSATREPPGRFGLVGHGWRAGFYLRIARAAPRSFNCVGVMARGERGGRSAADSTGVRMFGSVQELLRTGRPDVVVVSVPRAAAPSIIDELVDAGVRVLVETPPALDLSSLRALWERVGDSELVRVAEQHPVLPIFAAIERIIASGAVGDVTSAGISWTHDYHAMAMLRAILNIRGGAVRLVGAAGEVREAAGPDRYGKPGAVAEVQHTHSMAILQADGKLGFYDFTSDQWFDPLRQRRLVIRGSRGEIDAAEVTWLGGDGTPMTAPIQRRQVGLNGNLEGMDLDTLSWAGDVVFTNPFRGARLSDEEIAIATRLQAALCPERMNGYSLADAAQDQYLSLLVREAVTSGVARITERQPWQEFVT
ncbi:hypothetical protein BH11ACT1_BH11ACT1_03010 [soil metagenome]